MNKQQNSFVSIEAMDHENRWQAILVRDNRFDGAFVFAVRFKFPRLYSPSNSGWIIFWW